MSANPATPIAGDAPPEHVQAVAMTLRACQIAKSAVANAADALNSGDSALFDAVTACERELDDLDRDLDERIAVAVTQASPAQARDLLACMKLMTDLERIGDLVSSFAARARAVGTQLEMQDVSELLKMATVLEQMLVTVYHAFSKRDLELAVAVLRADAEIDRLRNLIYIRHVEGGEGVAQESLQVLFMAQALERAGDHAKNLAEEVCHAVSGHTLRHVLRSQSQSSEQLFLRWLREQRPRKT